MRTRFVAYNRLGARRGVLTHIMQAEIVPSKNELPTLTLTYPRSTPTHRWLLDSPEVAFEYWHPLNQNWVEPKNARFKLVTQDFDYLEEVETRNYTFIGIGEAIKGVYVFGPNGLKRNEEGKIQFANATPGQMLAHVWDYAVQRGWKGFSRSFSATVDSRPSAGQAWKNRMSISFAEDTSLESMLNYFSRMGLIDFEWEGRTLHVYNADTTMARDLSTGNNPVRFNLSGGRASVDAAPEANDHENLATHVVVTGENSLRWIFPTGLVLPEGRREVFLSYSGVDDEGTAQILAAPTIAKYSNSLKNTTRQFQISESTKLFPFLDYGVGDWVLVEKDDAQWERVQIFQLALLINQNGVQGYVSLGDKIDSLLERLNEAVQRVQGGSVNEGTEPPAPSAKEPSAPYGLVATARTVYSLKGEAKAVIGVNFAHSGLDVHGDPVAIDTYRVMYRKAEGAVGLRGWRQLFTISAPEQAGTHSYLDVMDHLGNLLTYEFEVIAVSSRGQESRPSSHVSLEMKYDAVPPKKPAKPTIKVSLAVFEIGTNHRTTTGSLQDIDYAHSIVEMATTPEGPWVERETIVPPSKSAWIGGEGYTTRWFRLVAVDWEGNRSEPSESVNGTAKSIVDEEFILSEIDAGKVLIKNGEKILIESGVELGRHLSDAAKALADTNTRLTGPGGLTERLDDAEDTLVETRGIVAANNTTLTNNLKSATDSLAIAQGEITKVVNRVSPLETGLNTLRNTTIPALTTSINGKTTIIRSSSAAANQANYSLGDRWEKWSTLSVGGKLLQTWRHNGSAWVEEILDATYIPLIDIGAGTFGSLKGGRLEANSVTADKVLIGIGGNLFPDPDMMDAEGYQAVTGMTWGGMGSGKLGRNSFTIPGTDTQSGSYYGLGTPYRRPPVVPGQQYRVSVWARTAQAAPARGVSLYLRFYDAGGFVTWGSPQNASNPDALKANEWTEISGIITAPDNAVNMTLGFFSQTTLTTAVRFSDPSIRQATGGQLIVNGSITGDHVDAQSVGAKVGTFVQINVDQIDVTGNANFKTAVADKLFVNMFSTNKISTNELLVGKGENLIPWLLNNEIGSRTVDPHVSLNGSSKLNIEGTPGTGVGGTNALFANATIVPGTYLTTFEFRPGAKTANMNVNVFSVLPNTKYKLSLYIRAGGSYASGLPNVRLVVGLYDGTGKYVNGPWFGAPKALTWDWEQITYEFTTGAAHAGVILQLQMDKPGTLRIDQPSFTKDGASLIATGGIVADHITASEEMSAKIGSFLKLDVGSLTATGTSTLDTAVINNLWANVVRSRSITTDMLLVGKGANLIPNGDLANGKDGWSNSFGIYVGDPSSKALGFPAALWYLGNGTANSPTFSLKGGTTYQFSMYARGNVSGKRFYVQLITDNANAASPHLVQNQLTYTSIRQYEAEVTVEAGVTSAYLRIFANHTNGDTQEGHQWFSGFEMYEKNAASLIVTGGIVTKHLKVTEDMTAALLRVKKVEAGEINFNSLFGDTGFIGSLRTTVLTTNSITSDLITANAITSKHTLTGPLIRTAASGARTEITRDGLRTVNAAGQELVKIGYGIETGISLRNPANNTLTPISAMVFGVALSRTSPIYPASMAKVGDSVSMSPSPGDIFTAAGSRAVMLVSVNGYSGANGAFPGGVTGNVMVEPPVVRVKAALKLVGSSGVGPSTWGAQVAYLNPGIIISGSGESYSSTTSFSVEINSLLVGRDYEVWVGFEYLKAPVVLNSSTNNMTFPTNVPVNVQTQIVVIPR